ncbi:MAG: hypothetical protein LUD72_13610, partial [Bacteroidales bacterium]|nr:hypothetical protein [Bacteroidales bacterium]
KQFNIMRQRIHLTESQLYGLVEQAINEISTETKMNAANKAAQQAARYRKQANTKWIPKLDREYAKDMATKRQRQRDTFVKGVNSDVNNEKGAEYADFFPNQYDSAHNRGALFIKEPVYYGHSVTDPMFSSDRKRWEDYLRGNSYYERGRG